MKLYKILKMLVDHGVSVFPPPEEELPAPTEIARIPWIEYFGVLRRLGIPDDQIGKMLTAWAYHARVHLNQAPTGIRLYVKMCVAETVAQAKPPEPILWGLVIAVATIVAVALGLYVWAVLDQEINVTFGTHEWAYLMSYEERLWPAEILNVGLKQEGVYERHGDFGNAILSSDRNFRHERGKDWIWIKPGYIVLEGRHPILYHVYRIKGFYVHFCGVLSHWAPLLYKLREGGFDPYTPTGPWSRPGGRWGTPVYRGCWREWWWL